MKLFLSIALVLLSLTNLSLAGEPEKKEDHKDTPVVTNGTTQHDTTTAQKIETIEAGKNDIEVKPTSPIDLTKDLLAFLAQREKEVRAMPDSPTKTKYLEDLKAKREATLDRVPAIKKISEMKVDGKNVLVAGINICGGAELGVIPTKFFTAGVQGSICVTIAHRINSGNLGGTSPVAALTAFYGAQAESKSAGGVEWQLGISAFAVADQTKEKVKLKSLEGIYGGVVGEFASATKSKLQSNLFTGVASVHERLGDAKVNWALGYIPYPARENFNALGVGWAGPIPYPKSDVYLIQPFTGRVLSDQSGGINVQGEVLRYRVLVSSDNNE